MATTLQDYEQTAPERPVFLTVICILTFVGSGWGLISGAIQYFTADKQANNIVITKQKAADDIARAKKDDKGAKFAEKMMSSINTSITPENIRKTGIAATLSALMCLGGALLMWQLNKSGFYLYIAGTLVSIAAPLVIYGSGSMIAIMSTGWAVIIGIAFLILYGVNLKAMK